ncbi:DUF6301 family protein [Nocardia sp. NPDC005978]|uniref:DUF6301 family protein n=1 Tax=Nocardia sp. NPDC005978 TaxID=3156725 RepID=UPI0033B0382D
MRIDVDHAARIAAAAAEFDWTWRPADLARWCAATGWAIAQENTRSARLIADPATGRPTATASYGAYPAGDRSDAGLWLEYLSINVAEAEAAAAEDVTATHAALQAAIGNVLGPPAASGQAPDAATTWRSPRALVSLHADSRSIALDVVNPRYFDRTDPGPKPSHVVAGPIRHRDWAALADALGQTLWRLPAPTYLIMDAPGNRFAQFAVAHDELSAEISSNTWLDQEFRMTAPEEIRMAELGWSPYSEQGCPNWYYDVAFPGRKPDFEASARRAVTTLREVMHISDPTRLRVEAWTVGTRLVPDLTELLAG